MGQRRWVPCGLTSGPGQGDSPRVWDCIQVFLVCSHTHDPSMAPKVSVVPRGLCQAGPNIHACGLWEALSGFYICLCFAAAGFSMQQFPSFRLKKTPVGLLRNRNWKSRWSGLKPRRAREDVKCWKSLPNLFTITDIFNPDWNFLLIVVEERIKLKPAMRGILEARDLRPPSLLLLALPASTRCTAKSYLLHLSPCLHEACLPWDSIEYALAIAFNGYWSFKTSASDQ